LKIEKKIEKLYKNLLEKIDSKDIKKLEKVFLYSKEKYTDKKLFIHLLESSILLSSISNDIIWISACLLRHILKYSSKEEIEKNFSSDILAIIENIQKTTNISYQKLDKQEKINLLNNIFESSNRDIRFFLVKICLRVNYIKNFWNLDEKTKKYLAKDTLEIYIPFIKVFWLAKYFSNIEDLCYQYIEPNEFNRIKKFLEAKRDFLEKKLKEIKKEIKKYCRKYSLKIDLQYRIKSIYSIHMKMKSKNIPFSGIYDLLAFRLIIESNKTRDTYLWLWIIHTIFKSKNNRIKDYISNPKINGYQSLHTTVIDNDW